MICLIFYVIFTKYVLMSTKILEYKIHIGSNAKTVQDNRKYSYKKTSK